MPCRYCYPISSFAASDRKPPPPTLPTTSDSFPTATPAVTQPHCCSSPMCNRASALSLFVVKRWQILCHHLLPQSQSLLAGCMTTTPSSSSVAALAFITIAIFCSNSQKNKRNESEKERKTRHQCRIFRSSLSIARYSLPLLDSTDAFFLGCQSQLYQFSTMLSNNNLCSIFSAAHAPCRTSSQPCLHPSSQLGLHGRRSQLSSDLHHG
ncbi:hypothetical protein B296_00054391 [Ensete ventricosum]|uniref:Uncharacterized protein n=1 Tax=Ensete ventricosum TaxID=4639 RepID=A0A426X6S6_ENSVE|nr:hypothetical protein B296_00054391 [Ensete ventricosum]